MVISLLRRAHQTTSEMKHRKSKLDAILEIKQKCKTILQATEKTIPKTSSETKKRPPVAWWNEECEREERIVKAEYRKHRRDPTNTTKL